MSYIKKVKRESPEFAPMVRLLEKVRGDTLAGNLKYPLGTGLIKGIGREQYDIDIGERVVGYEQPPYTPVDFGDEKNYLIFLLRWS